MLLLAASATLATSLLTVPADAQSRRERERERAERERKPPPNYEYAPEIAQCGVAFDASLKALLARPSPQPVPTAKVVRSPMPELTGRWSFHDAGDRRRQRDDLGRLVEGNQVCVEELSRGGRTRCGRWEARPEGAEAPVPVPQPTREETRVIGAISELVANKGAPPEFLSNGRYTIMTERVAADLEGFMAQEPHPAICSGVDELVDFFNEKLAPLKKRIDVVSELTRRSLEPIAPRVAALRASLAPPAPPLTVEANNALASGASVIAAPVAAAPSKAPASGNAPASQPTTPRAWLAEVAGLVLTPADSASVRDQPTPLAGLRRMAQLMGEGKSTVSPGARANAKAALRDIEAAIYVEMLGQRYRDLDQALFGTMDEVRGAHRKHCTCNG